MNASHERPSARLFIARHCPHCAAVLAAATDLVKQGLLARLEIVNADLATDEADALGIRSVPWTQIGEFELEGLHTKADLARWATRADTPQGRSDFLLHALAHGQLDRALKLVRRSPAWLAAVPPLLADLETPMTVRIGCGAILEECAGSPQLASLVSPLARLLQSPLQQVRADACHYLGLTADPRAAEFLQPMLDDPDPAIREIAAESLTELAG